MSVEQTYDDLVDSVYPPKLLREYYERKVAFYKDRLEIIKERNYIYDEQYVIPWHEKRYAESLAKLEDLDANNS